MSRFLHSNLFRVTTFILAIMLVFVAIPHIYCIKDQKTSVSNESPGTSYPNAGFFSHLAAYYRLLMQIQVEVDKAATTRKIVTGTIAYFPSQIYYYARVASNKKLKNICELGFGAGNSALLYLAINPHIKLYSFDLFPEPSDAVLMPDTTPRQGWYQKVTLNHIKLSENFSRRFTQVAGNSNLTISKFAQDNPDMKCDLIHIDGSHLSPQVYFDIVHFKKLSTPESYVIMDDVNEAPVRTDMEKAIAEGILRRYECLVPEQRLDENFRVDETAEKRFCAVHYQF